MKIVYVINSLASKGGAERIIIEKMNYLAERSGHEVSVICCCQNDSLPNAYPLSEKVRQIFLSIPYYSQYQYSFPYRLWVKRNISKQLKRGIYREIYCIDPDVLVGVSYFAADIVSVVKCRARKVIEAHEPRLFSLSNNGLNRSLISKFFMFFYKDQYFRVVEKHADIVVTLTLGALSEWRGAKHIEVIPCFSLMSVNINSRDKSKNSKRVIAVGRLEWEKGFDRLIEVWQFVANQHPDWSLDIFGSGSLKGELDMLIRKMGLSNIVRLHPFTPNIRKEYEDSYILVSPSRFEGFSLAILEAMQLGIPCVAFDCPYGPKEIVKDGVTGFLVPEGDNVSLANKICELIEHPEIRDAFSDSSIKRAKKFNVDSVMKKWLTLFGEGNY